jgi:predicted nucleotidyltransferase
MVALAIPLPDQALRSFCERWKVRELAVFGSVLRDDFRADSDIDLLVSFADDARWGLWDLIAAEQELAGILNRPVDLVERRSVEQSENWRRRADILNSAQTIYAG